MGVNYKSIDNADSDIEYFNSIGLTKVRINLPWAESQNFTDFLALSQKFYDAGFYTIYGSVGDVSAGYTWETYRSNTLLSAARAEGKCSEFQIGNEAELNNDDGYISDAQMRINIRALATEVQGVFSGIVSYAVESGTVASGHGSQMWEQEGKGDLDLISINTYGWATGDVVDPAGYENYLPSFINIFGTDCYISEFNLDADKDKFAAISESAKVTESEIMLDYIKEHGFDSAYLYQWRGYKDTNDDFAVKLIDTTILDMWNNLLTN